MKTYILGSHNSWSYLPVKNYKILRFMAKCQKYNIKEQYYAGVQCFDLRLRFNKNNELQVCHNFIIYNITVEELYEDLKWLNSNSSESYRIYVRVLLDVRKESLLTYEMRMSFARYCNFMEERFSNLKFWCGRNLVDWETEYKFKIRELTVDDKYASVALPKIIDDWWPWLYAKLHNRKVKAKGTDKDVLLIDFVNI